MSANSSLRHVHVHHRLVWILPGSTGRIVMLRIGCVVAGRSPCWVSTDAIDWILSRPSVTRAKLV